MTPDPLSEALSKLDQKYQTLTELHHCPASRTYLARDLELNRDVTITVARADRGDKGFLSAYAADAERLKAKHHPSIIPVLAGMWLDDQTFALVRARIRGSTLDQSVSAGSALPPPRIAEALSELTNALIWARDVGVTSRCIEPQTFVFQQGTGRVLIAFEPSRLIASDAHTIESLARTMNGGAALDVSQYTSKLGPLPVTSVPKAATAQPNKTNERQIAVPLGSDVAVVERPNRGMSFIGRVLTTFGIIGAVVVGAFMLTERRASDEKVQANAYPSGNAAGDVVTPPDAAPAYADIYRAPVIPPSPPPNLDSIGRANEERIAQAKAQAQAMSSVYGSSTSPYPYPYPSTTQPRLTPESSSVATTIGTRPPVDSLGRPALLEPCESPIESDQAQCLKSAIDRSDRSLNGVYEHLIDALRRQAGVAAGDPDPIAVEELRAAQRRWIQERDDACRSVGSGAFYARDRRTCYVERSTARREELQGRIESIP